MKKIKGCYLNKLMIFFLNKLMICYDIYMISTFNLLINIFCQKKILIINI